MKRVDIVEVETGEILGTVTTKYNDWGTLIDNVRRWKSRHKNYNDLSWVDYEYLRKIGDECSDGTYYMKEKPFEVPIVRYRWNNEIGDWERLYA